MQHQRQIQWSDSFCRLFWITYVYEGDLTAELSFTPQSGLTQLEDFVPYPTSQSMPSSPLQPPNATSLAGEHMFNYFSRTTVASLDMGAFQISSNSAIRRFLNRVSAVTYNPKDDWRKENHSTYAAWLLKVSAELLDHHQALHGNLPDFLLEPQLSSSSSSSVGVEQYSAAHQSHVNHDWNVSRLRGRYFAGLYVIHRPFVEYALLNPEHLDHNPLYQEIIEKCTLCFNGCQGFIETFHSPPANPMTNLFATGMA